MQKNKAKKIGKSTLKKITGWLHLWLGLISGIIVFVVALTGTLFVFCDETIDAFAGTAKYVPVEKTYKLTPDEMLQQFKKLHPERDAFYFDVYRNPNRSFRIASAKGRGSFAYTYINPYNGKELKTSTSYWFFYVVAHIHSQLLMKKAGQTIVGIATIIFFAQLIGGLILWWPKKWNSNTRTAAFKIKSGTKWRRKNYDLHNVLGFYAVIPAILLTVTGLIMAYEVLNTLTQKAFGGNPQAHELEEKYEPLYTPQLATVPYQTIVTGLFQKNATIQQVRLGIPRNDSATTYFTSVGKYIGLKSYLHGQRFLTNKYTGQKVQMPEDFVKHEVIEQVNFDLHVGYWGGFFGKIFTFIVGLICTSLPVTGIIIWWGRKFKKKKTVILQPSFKKVNVVNV